MKDLGEKFDLIQQYYSHKITNLPEISRSFSDYSLVCKVLIRKNKVLKTGYFFKSFTPFNMIDRVIK